MTQPETTITPSDPLAYEMHQKFATVALGHRRVENAMLATDESKQYLATEDFVEECDRLLAAVERVKKTRVEKVAGIAFYASLMIGGLLLTKDLPADLSINQAKAFGLLMSTLLLMLNLTTTDGYRKHHQRQVETLAAKIKAQAQQLEIPVPVVSENETADMQAFAAAVSDEWFQTSTSI